MKFAATPLMMWLGAFAGVAAAEVTKPAPPAPECAGRDVDPEKCVMQDGPPHKPIVRKKDPPPK